jgi:hypothetical protein
VPQREMTTTAATQKERQISQHFTDLVLLNIGAGASTLLLPISYTRALLLCRRLKSGFFQPMYFP